jgi:Protein of unknown function (DUF3499)
MVPLMPGSLLCARPGCQGIVAAWFTYDYTAQRVWLDDAPSVTAGNQWALCEEHARRLRPPKGWEQVDRRGGAPGSAPVPGLFPGPGAEATCAPLGGRAEADLSAEAGLAGRLQQPRRPGF